MTGFSDLSAFIFALLLTHGGAGKSAYSMEVLEQCGHDPITATCTLDRVCESASPECSKPRWSKSRNGWVRVESQLGAAERYERAARALTRAAVWLTRCKDAEGSVVEDCRPVKWPEGPRSIAMAMLSSSIWESGYREDIMEGHPPTGRGPDGEACVMQVMPQYISQYSDWEPGKPRDEMTPEDWAQEVLGSDESSLEHCYRAGGRMLAIFRSSARYRCKGFESIHSMYSFYGNGGKGCRGSSTAYGEYAKKRYFSYTKFMAKWPNLVSIPEWAVPVYGPLPWQISENTPASSNSIRVPDGVARTKDSKLEVLSEL